MAMIDEALTDEQREMALEFAGAVVHAGNRLGRMPTQSEINEIWRMVQTHHAIPEAEQTPAKWRLH